MADSTALTPIAKWCCGMRPRTICGNRRGSGTVKSLPEQEQSILILHCVLEMADGEIGNLIGMSRSAVQRHRTSTLKELRIKLMALMPGGR